MATISSLALRQKGGDNMRISCTALEGFRLFMNPENEWFTEEKFIADLRGESPASPAMELGTAFGRVLETPETYEVDGGYQHGQQFLSAEMMAPALALMDRRGVYEAKATKDYGACTVVAMADQIVGSHLIEHKTTLGQFDIDKYLESVQWRFMADIFEPSFITYHVFCLSDSYGRLELKSIESFNVYPYAAMHDECARLVDRFANYVESKGLGDLLRQRQRVAA